MKTQRSGYILVLALLLLTLGIVITTNIFNTGSVYSMQTRTLVDREKARQVAVGGLELAKRELTITLTDEQKEKQKNDSALETKLLLAHLLPVLNRMQRFVLKEAVDGLDGEVGICISSEFGKINLNVLYDFKNKKFIGEGNPQGDMRKVAQAVFNKLPRAEQDGMFAAFERFLKKQEQPLSDTTELLSIKEFQQFGNDLFYQPPLSKESRTVALTDIFTVERTTAELNPWLLSNSLCILLGLQAAEVNDISNRKSEGKKWAQNFVNKWTLENDWNTRLQPIYKKDFASLPKEFVSLLNTQFESGTFSVLSYGKVGNITQRVYAILEKQTAVQKGRDLPFVVKKMYWF
ncbi:hypothetical protein JW872_01350 [Candidatus Babeliales bacterium]|nr:hypothetical protein [Candidatus Babeliales bacterium]